MIAKAIKKPAGLLPRFRIYLVWLGWLVVVLPSIWISIDASYVNLSQYQSALERWVYIYLNFGSFIVGVIAALIIFWRKPTDWLSVIVSLMLVTWTSTSNGFEFWYSMNLGGSEALNWFIAYFFGTGYTLLLSTLLLCVLLTFPNKKWVPGWTRWLFISSLIGMLILPVYLCIMIFVASGLSSALQSFFLDILPELFRLGVLGLGVLAQIYRLFVTKDPLQRQQLKWIALSLVGMTFFYILYWLNYLVFGYTAGSLVDLTLFFLTLFFTYGFIVTFAISALRYHIWDIDIVINKTLVYTALTAIMGSLGITGAVLFELYADRYLSASSPLIGLLAILPLAILFVPLRDGLQNFVDSRFKPEEIDFSGTIVEFAPEAQLMLTSGDILKILALQVKEQLNVTETEIYLKNESSDLVLTEPIKSNSEAGALSISSKERAILEKGDVLVPADASRYSLYLPLTLRRASRLEFLGVLALGLRENGVGYSSSVLKSLKKFGVEAGKVFYIAKLRESTGRNIMERLASIEKGLANLKTDLV
ncbi:MAG: hypothetical protein IT314_15530 [Anaerolineales bacterium]|nr:hypothetical protein [Anaerolineales bacterium]